MAKKSNVHPDYYKTAGREPVGKSTVHEHHKQQFASAAKMESDRARSGKGGKPLPLTRPPKHPTNQPQRRPRRRGSLERS